MNGTAQTLLIDPDGRTREAIRVALAGTGRVAVVGLSSSYEAQAVLPGGDPPDMVVINLDRDREAALRLVRRLASDDPRLAVLPAASDPDGGLVLSAMRAGAREFLTLPPDPAELSRILDVVLRSHEHATASARKGPGLIAVTGAVGGVGCTTIAVNLAVSLARCGADPSLLVDLDLLFGSADVALDLLPDFTLLEATQRIDRVDEALLRRAVARHASGVQILPRPVELEDAAKIDPEALRRLLTIAKSAFATTIVDTSKALQSSDFVAFELADVILLVIQFDLFGLRNAARLIKLLRDTEGLGPKIRLIANRTGAFEAEIGEKKAELTLGAPIDWQLPNATRTIQEANAKGVPVVLDPTRTKVHAVFAEMARSLRPYPDEAAAVVARRGLLSSLFRRRPDLSSAAARTA